MKKAAIILVLIIAVPALIILAFLIIKARDVNRGREMVEKLLSETHYDKIRDLGTVDSLSVLPLVDFYADGEGLKTEAGVSYLVKAGSTTILMDMGENSAKEHPSPLLHNMKKLGVELSTIDFIFISHPHMDHLGGMEDMKQETFSLSRGPVAPGTIPAYVPGLIQPSKWNPGPQAIPVDRPARLAPGIATTGTIPRYLFIMGLTEEQVLAVNVKGKGIALIVGCGHPGIDRILQRATMIFNEPVYAVVGGLHFPVKGSRGMIGPVDYQYLIASDHAPWNGLSEADVDKAITALTDANLSIVALSPHDSSDWALARFKDKLGKAYTEVKVGREIQL